jgi:hypothetical protein
MTSDCLPHQERRAALGLGHESTITTMVNLASVFRAMGQTPQSEALLKEAHVNATITVMDKAKAPGGRMSTHSATGAGNVVLIDDDAAR